MPIDEGLANLSNDLLVVALVVYAVAMMAYALEYAFARRATRDAAVVADETVPAPTPVFVGAGAPSEAGDSTSDTPGAGDPTETARPLDAADADRSHPAVGEEAEEVSRPARAAMAGRLALLAMLGGVLAHAGSLIARGMAVDRVPWGNMYEFVSAVCLMAVAVSLVVVAIVRPLRQLGLFVLLPVVILLGLAGTLLYADAAPLVPALNSYWLKIHVAAAIVSSGTLLVGFVVAALYLIRERFERLTTEDKELRFPFTLGPRLWDSASLERLTFRVHAIAFPIWTFAIIAGAIWAEAAWTRYWGWDPKETWAFISWVVYAAYLHARATAGWRGTKAAWIAVAGWATMMINLFVINLVQSGLHSYADVN